MDPIQLLRKDINRIDDQLLSLLVERLEKAAILANIKANHHLPIEDQTREHNHLQELLKKVDAADGVLQSLVVRFFNHLFTLSKEYQEWMYTDL